MALRPEPSSAIALLNPKPVEACSSSCSSTVSGRGQCSWSHCQNPSRSAGIGKSVVVACMCPSSLSREVAACYFCVVIPIDCLTAMDARIQALVDEVGLVVPPAQHAEIDGQDPILGYRF